MAKVWVYTDFQIRIMNLVKIRVLSEFKSKGILISGGVFIKPKPKKSRLDLFELNCIGGGNTNRITKDLNMLININYQDESEGRVNEYTEFLYFVLVDSLLTKNLIFRRGYQDLEFQTCRISPYLWFGNCPLELTHINI